MTAQTNVNPLGSVNRDKTGLRYVRKGVTVSDTGLLFQVQRVRLGTAYGVTLIQRRSVHAPCSNLRVITL